LHNKLKNVQAQTKVHTNTVTYCIKMALNTQRHRTTIVIEQATSKNYYNAKSV